MRPWTEEEKKKHSEMKLQASDDSLQRRFWIKVQRSEGCWMWRGTVGGQGYGVIRVHGRFKGAHRVSYELAYGEIPDKLVVMHLCDHPSCVRPDHLRLGTKAENAADKVSKGRQARGEMHGHAKLTEEKVLVLRSEYAQGASLSELAEKYGISSPGVSDIVTGKNYKHLPVIPVERYGTDQWKKNISEAESGKPFTPEHLENLRLANSQPRTAEHRAKLGAAHKGKPSWNKGVKGSVPGFSSDPEIEAERRRKISEKRRGMVFSEEHRQKLAEAKRGRKWTPEHRQAIETARILKTIAWS